MDWMNEYFAEMDAGKRLEILNREQDAMGAESLFKLCRAIWERRYQKRPKGMEGTDYFIRSFMTIQTYSPGVIFRFGEKKTKEALRYDLFLEDVVSCGAEGEAVLYQEYCNCADYYYSLCVNSRSYRSKVFGTMEMTEKEVAAKVYNEIESLKESAVMKLWMKDELSMFIKAFYEVYQRRFPS